MTDQAPGHRKGRLPPGESLALFLVGIGVFAAGRWLANGAIASSVIQILGIGALLLAPLVWRAEGTLVIGLRGITLNLQKRIRLATEDHLEAIIKLAKAPHRDLAGMLVFLSGEVASGVVSVPPELEGARLVDERLSFVRQELQLSVVGIRPPGQDQWLAGGQVSTTRWQVGTKLLVCGPPASLEEFRRRLGSEAATEPRPGVPQTDSDVAR
ncbi:MAG: hypothetical protein ACRDJG_01655 [Actinomycetota bacterium]